MLRSIKELIGYPIEAVDGNIGKVKDCLFDDRHWRLRYVVVDTNRWLPGKKVLISPHHAKEPSKGWQGKALPVDLTKERIKNSPNLDENAPVSKQFESEYARYYNILHPYWSGPHAWGMEQEPSYIPAATVEELKQEQAASHEHELQLDHIEHSHLRSAHEVIGYTIHAKDDVFGHVADFIVDVEKWKLLYLIVDTRNWLPGKKSIMDIGWIETFDWHKREATVDLSRKQIEKAPRFDPSEPINREYEHQLYDYYGRPYHWNPDPVISLHY